MNTKLSLQCLSRTMYLLDVHNENIFDMGLHIITSFEEVNYREIKAKALNAGTIMNLILSVYFFKKF